MLIPKIGNFSDAGVFAIAISICSIMNVLSTFTIYNYQLYDKYETYDESQYFTFRLFTIAITIVVCLAIVMIFGYNLNQSLVVLAYLLYRIIINFMSLYTTKLQIEKRLDVVGKCMILEGIVSFVTFIMCYMRTNNLFLSTLVMALIGGLSYAISLIIYFKKLIGRNYDYGSIKIDCIKPLAKIGIMLFIPALVMCTIPAISKIGLQLFYDDTITGIFSTLTSPTVAIQVLVSSVLAPFLIKFSSLAKEGRMDEFKKSFTKVIVIILGIGVLGIIVSLLFAKFFFNLLYGSRLDDYIYLFNWMIIAIVFMSIATSAITILAMENRKKISAVSSITSLAISIIIFGLMIPSGGIEGSTYALVISNLIFAILTSICVYANIKDDDNIYDKSVNDENIHSNL